MDNYNEWQTYKKWYKERHIKCVEHYLITHSGLHQQMMESKKPYYNDITLEKIDKFLLELSSTKKGKEIIDNCFVEYIGNGLYKYGNIIFGKKGLEEFDKVLREKVKEQYGRN